MCGGKIAIPPIVKEKRRNSEKRREKSRDAARCRRSKESEIFTDLSQQLPVTRNAASSLDKVSVMRLTVGFLKLKEMVRTLLPVEKTDLNSFLDPEYASALDGFLLILSEKGDIMYTSENIEDFLGVPHIEMIGQTIYDYAHPCDHEEVKQFLTFKSTPSELDKEAKEMVSVFIRMKSMTKSKGKTVNLKSAAYQVIHYTGCKSHKSCERGDGSPSFYFALIGKTIPHPAQIDIPLDKDIFLSRHSPDMKFTHVDGKVSEFLGYRSSEMIGKSAFSFHHTLDSMALASSFQTLFSKGQCETAHYRFMAKHGGSVWVMTQATLIYDKDSKIECVVCLNYVLSKIENEHEIVSEQQVPKEQENNPVIHIEEDQLLTEPALQLSSTSSVFASKEHPSEDAVNFTETDNLLTESLSNSKFVEFFATEPGSTENDQCKEIFITYPNDALFIPDYGNSETSIALLSSSDPAIDDFSTSPNTPDSGCLSDLPSFDPIEEIAELELDAPMYSSDGDSDCFEGYMDFRAPFISMNLSDDYSVDSPSEHAVWELPADVPLEIIPESYRFLIQEKQQSTPVSKIPSQQNYLDANQSSSQQFAMMNQHAENHGLEMTLLEPIHAQSKVAVNKTLPCSPIRNDDILYQSLNSSGSFKDRQENFKMQALREKWPFSPVTENDNHQQKSLDPSRSYVTTTPPNDLPVPFGKDPDQPNFQQTQRERISSGMNFASAPHLGCHTAMVKVKDKLLRVQVSVSEITSPITNDQPSPSPPDPPPKRSSPLQLCPAENPKRLKADSGFFCTGTQDITTNSVLLNLLLNGEDASQGYLSSENGRYLNVLSGHISSALLQCSADQYK